MATDVNQVLELAQRPAGPAFVTVVAPDGSVPSDVEAALAEDDAELIVRTAALSEGEELVEQAVGPLVLVVPSTATVKEMRAALRAGVAGLVREPNVRASLAATVRAVRGGQLVVPLELGRQIEKPVLSRRQKQVLGLVVLGLSNGEIAAKLHLSEHTVKCHLYSGFRKLGVSSRDEAVAMILDPEGGFGTGILAISEAEPEVAAHGHR